MRSRCRETKQVQRIKSRCRRGKTGAEDQKQVQRRRSRCRGGAGTEKKQVQRRDSRCRGRFRAVAEEESVLGMLCGANWANVLGLLLIGP